MTDDENIEYKANAAYTYVVIKFIKMQKILKSQRPLLLHRKIS